MKSREIALCGMMNALAVVIMNLGGIVPMVMKDLGLPVSGPADGSLKTIRVVKK